MRTTFAQRSFAGLGLLLAGCSTFTPNPSVDFPSGCVGDDRQFAPGEATRAQIIAAFGEPGYRSADDRRMGYLFAPLVGTRSGWLIGPCSQLRPGTRDVHGMDDLWLAFDEHGVLERVAKGLVKMHDGSDAAAWDAFRKQS